MGMGGNGRIINNVLDVINNGRGRNTRCGWRIEMLLSWWIWGENAKSEYLDQ
jgi:hypothetical protein